MTPALTFGVMLGWCLVLGVIGVTIRRRHELRERPWRFGQCAACSPAAQRRQVNRELTKYRRVWRQLDEDWE